MSSVTYTGTCFLPSYTAKVCPTNSGKMVERRDQVLITRFSFFSFSSRTFFSKCSSAKGPFFRLRPMHATSLRAVFLRVKKGKEIDTTLRRTRRFLEPLVPGENRSVGEAPPPPRKEAQPLRRRMMYLSEGLFFFRVLKPRVGLPHGVIGDFRPMGAFPSPPPCGWSTAFIPEPRTVGRRPSQRARPALPIVISS